MSTVLLVLVKVDDVLSLCIVLGDRLTTSIVLMLGLGLLGFNLDLSIQRLERDVRFLTPAL